MTLNNKHGTKEQCRRTRTGLRSLMKLLRWRKLANVSEPKLQFRGKELMDQYRKVRTEFVTREEQLRDERLASSRRALKFVNVSVVALCVLIGGILAALGRKQLMDLSRAFDAALDTAEANANEVRAQ